MLIDTTDLLPAEQQSGELQFTDPNAPQPAAPAGYTPFRVTGTQGAITGFNRQPIRAPSGAGVSMPDMGPGIAAAFQNLPVDQALKAIEAANLYQGQRGYQADIAAGISAPVAFAKWAPMLIPKTGTGSAALARTLAGPTAQQQAATALMQARTRALTNPAPKVATPHEVAEETRWTKEDAEKAAQKIADAKQKQKATVYRAAMARLKDLDAGPEPDAKKNPVVHADWVREKALQDRYQKIVDDYEASDESGDEPAPDAANPDAATGANPAKATTANEVIRLTGDGKKAVFDASTKQFLRYAQ